MTELYAPSLTIQPNIVNIPRVVTDIIRNGQVLATIQQPNYQGNATSSHPYTYSVSSFPDVALGSIFKTANKTIYTLPKTSGGPIRRLGIYWDIETTGTPGVDWVQYAPIWNWFEYYYPTQTKGNNAEFFRMYPVATEIWLRSCVKDDHLAQYAEEYNVKIEGSKNTGKFFTLTDPVFANGSTKRFILWFDNLPINDLHLNNTLLTTMMQFVFSGTKADIIANKSTNGGYTVKKTGFRIASCSQSALEDKYTIAEIKSKVVHTKIFPNFAILSNMVSPVTINVNGTNVNPINIDTMNTEGFVGFFVIQATTTVVSSDTSNQGYGISASRVHFGDQATMDFLNQDRSLINNGEADNMLYFQRDFLGRPGNLLSTLLSDRPDLILLPLTFNYLGFLHGRPEGFRPQTKDDKFTIRINPTVQVPEVLILTKAAGAFAYTAGNVSFTDPVTGDTTAQLPFDSSIITIQNAIMALPRLATTNTTVTVSSTFTTTSATITFTISSYLLNGLGGVLIVNTSGLICNSLPEIPSIIMQTKGQRGVTNGMVVNLTGFAVVLNYLQNQFGELYGRVVTELEFLEEQVANSFIRGDHCQRSCRVIR